MLSRVGCAVLLCQCCPVVMCQCWSVLCRCVGFLGCWLCCVGGVGVLCWGVGCVVWGVSCVGVLIVMCDVILIKSNGHCT